MTGIPYVYINHVVWGGDTETKEVFMDFRWYFYDDCYTERGIHTPEETLEEAKKMASRECIYRGVILEERIPRVSRFQRQEPL